MGNLNSLLNKNQYQIKVSNIHRTIFIFEWKKENRVGFLQQMESWTKKNTKTEAPTRFDKQFHTPPWFWISIPPSTSHLDSSLSVWNASWTEWVFKTKHGWVWCLIFPSTWSLVAKRSKRPPFITDCLAWTLGAWPHLGHWVVSNTPKTDRVLISCGCFVLLEHW